MELNEQLLAFAEERKNQYFTAKEAAGKLGLSGAQNLKQCYNALNALVERGELVVSEKGKYALPSAAGLVKCRLRGNPKGFAFALVPEGDDVFIPARRLNGALHNDIVLVKKRAHSRGDSPEGEVAKIVERGDSTVVGTFRKMKNYGVVEPDDKRFGVDLYVKRSADLAAKDGDKVVASITRYPKTREDAVEAAVTEIIGSSGDPWLDILSIMRQHNIKEEFPEEVKNEVAGIPSSVSEAERAGRKDFRSLTTITVDGADARDFDDAISISKNADGTYRLGVHIADVAHYVTRKSPLDQEAAARGTSVYFPDRAVPMLPKELSNGICSLNEGVDRLTLSVLMDVNEQGAAVNRTICEGVIRSRNRMTYSSVTKILEGDTAECGKYRHLVPMITLMNELTDILMKKRDTRGSIDFDMPESKITLDENGKVVDVAPYERTKSHRMIEEFMILANETVAEYCAHLSLPCMYRVHERPNGEKILEFKKFLNALGLSLKGRGELHSRQLLDLLESIKEKPVYPVVNRVMLRSMQKAKYAPANIGHFGLASPCYCHFTSPIRRYPDLFVHRVLKLMLHGELDRSVQKRLEADLPDLSLQCSEREKLADEAERDADDLKKAEFMLDKIGNRYEGVVSGVTSFGVFVELPNTVEGLVRVENLPKDAYRYLENAYSLVGSKRTYRLGDKMAVAVAAVNKDSRRIDFLPAEEVAP